MGAMAVDGPLRVIIGCGGELPLGPHFAFHCTFIAAAIRLKRSTVSLILIMILRPDGNDASMMRISNWPVN